MLQNGVPQRCARVKLSTQGGGGGSHHRGVAPLWGSAKLREKVSHDMGYRSDSIAIPKGARIEKIQSRLKFSISLENINLD